MAKSLVMVNGIAFNPITLEGQRVLTIPTANAVHHLLAGSLANRFKALLGIDGALTEGRDYIHIKGPQDKKDLPRALFCTSGHRGYLLTESGYRTLADFSGSPDNKAVMEKMVRTYFKGEADDDRALPETPTKDESPVTQHEVPTTFAAALRLAADKTEEAEARNAEARILRSQLEEIRDKANIALQEALGYTEPATVSDDVMSAETYNLKSGQDTTEEVPTPRAPSRKKVDRKDRYTPRDLGKKFLGYSANEMNAILEDMGLQMAWEYSVPSGPQTRWKPTEKGERFGIVYNKTILWDRKVVPFIRKFLEEEDAE